MSKNINLVIVDDHKLFRQGLISLLKDFNEKFNIIGEADNGKNLLALLKIVKPDIVLLDMDMPVMSGEEAFDIIIKEYPGVKVIFLSMHYNEELASRYLSHGASAYLKKESSAEILIEAIETVYKGKKYCEPVLNMASHPVDNNGETNYPAGKRVLSGREIEVIKHICDGKSNKEIADTLFISLRTVDFHRGNIYAKTRAGNPAALAVYALRHGIISF
ncbi:MAG: response regulator [Bacteroidia bacterium]